MVDIQVSQLNANPEWLNILSLYRNSVQYPYQPVDTDPYTYSRDLVIEANGGPINISDEYMLNDATTRHAVLRGILDAYQESGLYKYASEDVVKLARSLGLPAYIVENGSTFEILGTTVGKRELLTFTISGEPDDEYFGVQVGDNHRYIMADYTVTCNSNGKSKLLELMQKAIGDYFCILPIALLTQKRVASNSAQSELERTKGRRFAVMQEPGENEKINIGLMKELSGGDRIICRGLFKEPIEFKPQFKMAMTCNELPEVPSDDGGTWRRIRVIEHKSKFVEFPNPRNPNEFLMDPEIVDKFDRWADMFISMLIYHHSTIDPKNILEPREVKNSTEGYKKNNDIIGQFVGEKMQVDEESTDRISINKVYNDFKGWVSNSGIKRDKKIPDRNQFRAYMEKQFGAYPSDGKGWRGIRYMNATASDDVE